MTNSTDRLAHKIPEKIEEEKKERKFMFQFVNHETGQRSEPFIGSWETVKKILNAREEGERPVDKDYILLVAILNGEDTQIPATPLITIKTFMEFDNHQIGEAEQENISGERKHA